VVENTLQLLILELPEESSWKPRSKNEHQQQSARPSKKQNRRKQSEPTAKPHQRQQQTKKKGLRSKLPFKCSR